ncbi:MAG: hypothetical protein AAGA69_03775, partial [Pseudomonadota bacterium]
MLFKFLRLVLLSFSLLLVLPGPAGAQTLPGGSGGEEQRKPGLFSDILDAIGSGSRLLIDTIQPGEERDRVENPRFNSLESPRHTIMTFMHAMALVDRGYTETGYARALPTLPEGASTDQADQLYQVLLRLGPISPSALPGTDQIGQSGDSRFAFFPRGTEHAWVWSAVDTPPTGEIAVVLSPGGEWTFSTRTMADVSGL